MHTPFTIGVAGHVDHGKTTLVRANIIKYYLS